MPLAAMCRQRLADMPNGAHMEIGTYGDLDTMHWVQNEPWAADVLNCHVTYGAAQHAWRALLPPAHWVHAVLLSVSRHGLHLLAAVPAVSGSTAVPSATSQLDACD